MSTVGEVVVKVDTSQLDRAIKRIKRAQRPGRFVRAYWLVSLAVLSAHITTTHGLAHVLLAGAVGISAMEAAK